MKTKKLKTKKLKKTIDKQADTFWHKKVVLNKKK